jgi:DNA-binding MarR family transcriptional regulator
MGAARGRPADSKEDPVAARSAVQPERCNGSALRKATRRVSQLYDAALAPCGLRATQRSILVHIARAGAPTMRALATALVLDPSALAHNLKPLERDGLVAVTVGPDDRRSRVARLTERGEAKLRESGSLWQAAQDRFEQAFGADRAEALRATLAIVASIDFGDAFEAAEPPPAKRPHP